MTEIKTAQAWGDTYETDVEGIILLELDDDIEMEIPYSDARVPVVIVYGMTEAEVHEAAALRSACRELGIETVEQLKVKTKPDPRVALLDALGVKGKKNLIGLLSGVVPHKYINEAIDKLIAAQRGEVDG